MVYYQARQKSDRGFPRELHDSNPTNFSQTLFASYLLKVNLSDHQNLFYNIKPSVFPSASGYQRICLLRQTLHSHSHSAQHPDAPVEPHLYPASSPPKPHFLRFLGAPLPCNHKQKNVLEAGCCQVFLQGCHLGSTRAAFSQLEEFY